MGTSIYIHLERKDLETGIWRAVPQCQFPAGRLAVFFADFQKSEPVALSEASSQLEPNYLLYSGKNEDLFEILAGYEEVKTDLALSQPRGLPTDVSKEVRLLFDAEGPDAHTASYLTLAELERHPWDREWVDENEPDFGDIMDDEWREALHILRTLGAQQPEFIRIVFWFY